MLCPHLGWATRARYALGELHCPARAPLGSDPSPVKNKAANVRRREQHSAEDCILHPALGCETGPPYTTLVLHSITEVPEFQAEHPWVGRHKEAESSSSQTIPGRECTVSVRRGGLPWPWETHAVGRGQRDIARAGSRKPLREALRTDGRTAGCGCDNAWRGLGFTLERAGTAHA